MHLTYKKITEDHIVIPQNRPVVLSSWYIASEILKGSEKISSDSTTNQPPRNYGMAQVNICVSILGAAMHLLQLWGVVIDELHCFQCDNELLELQNA